MPALPRLGASELQTGSGAGEPLSAVMQRLLVVDDNRDAADSLALLLEALGAEVHVAHDGAAALDAFERFAPQYVLLDLGMPGMDGLEVARRLRGRANGHAVTLIALTGWGQPDDREAGSRLRSSLGQANGHGHAASTARPDRYAVSAPAQQETLRWFVSGPWTTL